MSVFVVTQPENGWDCVISVYEAENREQVMDILNKQTGLEGEDLENQFCIFEKTIQRLNPPQLTTTHRDGY